jgi:hypothetical protein
MRKVRTPTLFLLVAVLAVLAGLAGGCNTPTLPIPPPIVEALEAPDPVTGLVTVRITASIPERVTSAIVLNDATQHGVIEARLVDGTFVLQIPAESGDYLQCFFLLQFTEIGQGTAPLLVP